MENQGNNNRTGMMMGGDGNQGGMRKKNRVFAPVTMKMIEEAVPQPEDVCEIDGE